MRFNCTTLPGSCGYGVLYAHGNTYIPYMTPDRGKHIIRQNGGGTRYNMAAFVNEPRCKEVYNFIKEHYDIVYQSPVVRNHNSGLQNFMVVFKEKSE